MIETPENLGPVLSAMPALKVSACAFLGSFVLYILNRTNGVQPFSLFKAINVPVHTRSKPFIVLADMFISSIIGSAIVVLLTDPSTTSQAVAAGLGMTGLLSAAGKAPPP